MPQQHDREYLEHRLHLSAEKARTATDSGVARVHDEFARAYAQRLRQQMPRPVE